MSDVVLVHGLWYRTWTLARLRRQLADAGHTVHGFSYPSLARSPEQNAVELSDFCLRHCCGTTHLVGHSLGGLVILAMLKNEQLPPLGRIVFLGTPLNGSLVARRLGGNKAGKYLLGAAAPVLSEGLPLNPDVPECGMIAGTYALGLGRVTGALEGPNDGTVSVTETMSGHLSDLLVLNVSHTGLLLSGEVARQVALFLDQGCFQPGKQGADSAR